VRAYLLDEISTSDMEKIAVYLKEKSIRSRLDSVFWIEIPASLLSGTQYEHKSCRPYVFAAELGDDWFKAEFLVRSLEGMGCDCQNYATPQQREFILDFSHAMIDVLDVRT
jgi:hypothetical protein